MVKLVSEIKERELAPELMLVQAKAIKLATKKTDDLLTLYKKVKGTMGGRYVCADSFKEVFPAFEKKEDRAKVNTAIHNSASVLAATQFEEILKRDEAGKSKAIFITGIPGSGKTTTVLTEIANSDYADKVKIVFEGQLSNPAPAIPKIERCLEKGLEVEIFAVHLAAEKALDNTYTRFKEQGRGASIGIMSDIQANLPNGLKTLKERFGEAISISVINKNTDELIENFEEGIKTLTVGTQQEIWRTLADKLLSDRIDGNINSNCFDQGRGIAGIDQLDYQNSKGKKMGDEKQRVIVMNKTHLLETQSEGKWVTQKVTPAPEGMKSGVYMISSAKTPENGKEYEGQIIHKDKDSVFQKSGSSIIRHDMKTFDKAPELGANVSIKCDSMKSLVSGIKNEKKLSRGR